ncbi:MAG: hypothetical protein L6R00_17265 [Phycisphaerae bacterium]|nr:hypothetical protein [Phycisphaerae bacterium]
MQSRDNELVGAMTKSHKTFDRGSEHRGLQGGFIANVGACHDVAGRVRDDDVVPRRTVEIHLVTEIVKIGLKSGRVCKCGSSDTENLGLLRQSFGRLTNVRTPLTSVINAPKEREHACGGYVDENRQPKGKRPVPTRKAFVYRLDGVSIFMLALAHRLDSRTETR